MISRVKEKNIMKTIKVQKLSLFTLILFFVMMFQFTKQVSAAEVIDFGIESIAFTPAQLYSNSSPVLTVKVKNNGGPIDNAQVVVDFVNSRTDAAGVQPPKFKGISFSRPYANPRIAAGEVLTLTTSLYNAQSLPAGNYSIKAMLTTGGTAYNKDSNAANDQATLAYPVLAGNEPGTNGDLSITGYKFIDKNTYHELVVDTVNLGTDPLKCNFNVQLTAIMSTGVRQVFAGKQIIYPAGTALAPGATKQLVFQVVDADTKQRLANGTYKLSLSAWATNNSCPETSSANNFKEGSLIIGSGSSTTEVIDFGIESIAFTPAQLYSNSNPVLTVKVKNNGGPIDNAQVVVDFVNSRTDAAGVQPPKFKGISFSRPYANPRIAAGEVLTLTTSLYNAQSLPAGNYSIKAMLTTGGTAYNKDSNAANDQATLAYPVLAGNEPGTNGDLSITGYKFIDKNTYHELVVDTVNLGTDPLKCNFNVQLTAIMSTGVRQVFAGKQIIYPAGTALAPGATKQLVFQVVDADTKQRLANGTYKLSLSAWATNNSCPETSSANNFKEGSVAVRPYSTLRQLQPYQVPINNNIKRPVLNPTRTKIEGT
jgi:uncharacterized GH25 family protein